jgi:chaperone BCS1
LVYKFEKEYASDRSVLSQPRIWRFVFSSDGGSWDDPREFQPRSLKSVIIGGGVKEKLLSVIDKFSKSEDWYIERGFPYQLGIMLKGFPGCGKTSLIRALATELQRDIYPISLPSISDNALIAAIRLAPKKSLIVMEDFNVAALKARNADLSVNSNLLPREDSSNQVSFLSLHGFLQAMDGLDTGGGNIIFMTTNVYDELDTAVTRPGRVDYTFELEKLSSDDVKDYIRLMYPESVIPDVTFKTISGAELQSIYLDHHDSEKSFIDAIPKE